MWRCIAVALMTFILGAGIPIFFSRAAATKDDVTSAIIPVQRQLDDQAAAIGALRNGSEQTDVAIAQIATKLNITAHPVP